MMDKQGVYRFLREQGVEYECVEHPAACNMEEMSQIPLPHPEADAKNLFVRDDNKRNYAPKTQSDPLHPLFVEALKNISGAEYNLSCAEIARYEYEKRNSRDS